MPQKKDNNTQVNKEQTANSVQEKKDNNIPSISLKPDVVTLYIDKNCEDAKIPQCQSELWKKQFDQLLKGAPYKVEYINDKNIDDIKKVASVTPVLAIPAKDLSYFGPDANEIKKVAKFANDTYFTPISAYGWIPGEENLCNDGKDNNGDGKIDAQDPTCFKMDVLSSSNCKDQYCNPDALKNMFMGYNINIVDYETDEGKKLYNELVKTNWTQYLPTFLFNQKKDYLNEMRGLVKEINLPNYKYQINIPSFRYNPVIEACKKDCNASPSCKNLVLECAKTDKPNVDLYVMSYCPFGTQAEKGILQAVNKLKGKINFKVKFVNYAMHGKKEIDENNLQYCIQKEEPEKYNDYLTCFLEAWNSQDCIKKANLDMNKINKCIEEVKSTFKTEEDYNNKQTWLNGRFPQYRVYDEENKKYGVQWSPTLVINGIKVQPTSRSPQAYLDIICKAFKNPPKECSEPLSNQNYDPMWGWTQNGKAAPAGSCGN